MQRGHVLENVGFESAMGEATRCQKLYRHFHRSRETRQVYKPRPVTLFGWHLVVLLYQQFTDGWHPVVKLVLEHENIKDQVYVAGETPKRLPLLLCCLRRTIGEALALRWEQQVQGKTSGYYKSLAVITQYRGQFQNNGIDCPEKIREYLGFQLVRILIRRLHHAFVPISVFRCHRGRR